MAAKRRPAREAVLAREHEPGVGRAQRADLGVGRARKRGVVGPHDRDPALEAALDDAAQAFGAILVVADLVDERVRELGPVGRDPLDVGLEARPAREAIFAREQELRLDSGATAALVPRRSRTSSLACLRSCSRLGAAGSGVVMRPPLQRARRPRIRAERRFRR